MARYSASVQPTAMTLTRECDKPKKCATSCAIALTENATVAHSCPGGGFEHRAGVDGRQVPAMIDKLYAQTASIGRASTGQDPHTYFFHTELLKAGVGRGKPDLSPSGPVKT